MNLIRRIYKREYKMILKWPRIISAWLIILVFEVFLYYVSSLMSGGDFPLTLLLIMLATNVPVFVSLVRIELLISSSMPGKGDDGEKGTGGEKGSDTVPEDNIRM